MGEEAPVMPLIPAAEPDHSSRGLHVVFIDA